MTTKLKKVAIKRVTKKQTIVTETPVKRGPGRPRKVVIDVVKKPEVINIVPTITTSTQGSGNIRVVQFSLPNDISRNYVYVFDAPTGSCQLFSAAYFQNLKWLDSTAKLKYRNKPFKIDYRPIITAIRKSIYNKNLLFIDVKSTLTPFVKELFNKGEIISETPYKSTNGSNMVLYTIDVREF